MNLYQEQLFHIYNRGNNQQTIFFERENYVYFLEKVRDYLKPHSEIISWCLMPNHFHLMVYISSENTIKEVSKAIQVILRSYTRDINKQRDRTGSLFAQNTCSKALSEKTNKADYPTTCFHYIHQNPMNAGLVIRMEDWEFSSFRDYIELRNGKLINKKIALELIEIPANREQFYKESYGVINESHLEQIF